MTKFNKTQLNIIKLAKLKGSDADLLLMTEIDKVDDKVDSLEENLSVKIENKAEELKDLIPEAIVGERGEKGIQGIRGNKFLGSFKTKNELPEIDGVNVIEGDYVYIDDTGTIWYA